MKQLISNTVIIELKGSIEDYDIESLLKDRYGEIVRWAIVAVENGKYKICLTYEKT